MLKRVISASVATVIAVFSASAVVFAEEPGQTQEQIILNSAQLEETYAVSPALNDVVEDLLDELITEDMDTYTKVKTCYDYLVDNMSYGSSMGYLGTPASYTTCGNIYYANGEVEGFGAVALTANKGQCNGYAAGFILMARRIGLEARLVEGSTLNGGGGYSYHKWAEVIIDGEIYVFDPQVGQSMEKYGISRDFVFCKTYAQLGARYRKTAAAV